MENASKALIIAAGILITILLITIGIRIFNSIRDNIDSSKAVGDSIEDQIGKATDNITGGKRFFFKIGKDSLDTITIRIPKEMKWSDFVSSEYNIYGFETKMAYVNYNLNGKYYRIKKFENGNVIFKAHIVHPGEIYYIDPQ